MWTAPGQPRPDAAQLFATLNRFSRTELEARRERLDRATRELGVHYAVVDDQPIDDQEWQLDILPRLLTADEWSLIERGLIQRARAFNAYIADVYGDQRILRERVVPYEIVLSDPAFHRQLIGLPKPGDAHAPVGAMDLVRNPDGEWQVLENHFSTPFGISYVLQCRRMLAQAFPELFETSDVAPVAPFVAQLAELLRARSTRPDPRIVLLCRGEDNQSYFEESFLGRNLGIPMVQPADLLVRESNVFLKTIRGLEQIDVIYRRIESSSIDPIAFGYSRFQGVPGLVNCVRKGNVAIVNAIGCGVADNRAILRYSDRIIHYYLHEKPLLKTVPTFTCRDQDQALHVLQNLDQMVLKPIHDLNTMQKYYGAQLDLGGNRDLRPALASRPELLVGQPRLAPSRAPRFQNGHFVSRTVFLRAFVLLGNTPVALPGGLTRQALSSADGPRLTIMTGGMKDTWVPSISPGAPAVAAAAPEAAGEEFSIGSRVAEMLYWMGRYLERAENTARQLNILETVRWDALGREAQSLYWPLWRAVATSTGQAISTRKTPPRNLAALTRAFVLDRHLPASVHSCVRGAIANAASIRDIVSPELWQVLNQLGLQLEAHSTPKRGQPRPRLREICQLVVDETRRAAGVAERTMLHDEAWQFFRVGTRLERSIDTLSILHALLGPAGRAELGRLDQETDLIALLRLLCSLDAYRRAYRSRAYLERVVALMLRNSANPSGVAHCLRQLRLALANLQTHPDFDAADSLLRELEGLSAICENFDPARVLATGGPDLLGDLRRQVEGLHPRLEDTYFSHQHLYARKEQTQLELP
jgi:uncharacterized circularly permuted ATP-grasp superfamily protein/uncharacterized alpha-E superfamily protein